MTKPAARAPQDDQTPDEPQQAMHRTCLVCKRRFVSSWTGARICDECRKDREPGSVDRARK